MLLAVLSLRPVVRGMYEGLAGSPAALCAPSCRGARAGPAELQGGDARRQKSRPYILIMNYLTYLHIVCF